MTKEQEIIYLIAKGEGEQLDFKEAITSRTKIAKTLVAFANSKGGRLLIGVKDNGKIKGIDPMEEQQMLMWAAEESTYPSISIDFQTVIIDRKAVLVADIKESLQKPHYAMDDDGKEWAYLRTNDQTIKASKIMLDVMRMDSEEVDASIVFGKAEKRLFEYLELHKRITYKEFAKLCNISRRKAGKILVQLIRMRLVKVFCHEKEDYYTL